MRGPVAGKLRMSLEMLGVCSYTCALAILAKHVATIMDGRFLWHMSVGQIEEFHLHNTLDLRSGKIPLKHFD